MDVSGEVADLMVKESIEVTDATIKMLAGGGKNLLAFLLALAKDDKKLVGKTNMAKLLREGKKIETFHIKEEDIKEFRAFAKKNVLFAFIKDKKSADGMVDLVTNVDFVSQVNLFMARHGYAAPTKVQEDEPKKAEPRAPQKNSSPERGNGSTPLRMRTTTEEPVNINDIPTVKGRLAMLQAASAGISDKGPRQKSKEAPTKTR